jgi:hypothetical protein
MIPLSFSSGVTVRLMMKLSPLLRVMVIAPRQIRPASTVFLNSAAILGSGVIGAEN